MDFPSNLNDSLAAISGGSIVGNRFSIRIAKA